MVGLAALVWFTRRTHVKVELPAGAERFAQDGRSLLERRCRTSGSGRRTPLCVRHETESQPAGPACAGSFRLGAAPRSPTPCRPRPRWPCAASCSALLPADRLVLQAEDLFAYECDAQTLDRGLPLAVAFPATTEEVVAIVKACAEHGVPFLAARGGHRPVGRARWRSDSVVISTARMNQIHEIDVPNRQAWVGPGVVNAHLSRAVAAHGLHYAPDPSSQNACTIGGNVAENSGGPHTLKYGVTTNHVLALEVVLPDGSLVAAGRRRGGYARLRPGLAFVGSEGTFGIATKILVRLTPSPEGVRTVLAIFDQVGRRLPGGDRDPRRAASPRRRSS